jgi:hypothetical protein
VDGLTHPQRLIPVLEQLGARHAGYMVQDHHYGLVGEALLWTLREGLGDDFTPETESAWREVYGLVASVMKKAAATSAASAPPVPAKPPAPPSSAPPVPEEFEIQVARPSSPGDLPAVGESTIPYPLLAQNGLLGLQPYGQPGPHSDETPTAVRPLGAPPAALGTPSISVPLNVPREVNVNFHLNVKLEADAALSALALRAATPQPPAPAPAPAPEPAPVRSAAHRHPPAEPAAPPRATVSPVLLVALCVLVSVSTVFALGPLTQAAASLAWADLPRLGAPVFTLAALAVGYLWGRGRGSERQK